MTTKPNHAPMIIERALMAHRIDRFFIAKSFLRGDWIVIHRGQIIDRAQKHEIAITKTKTPAANVEEKRTVTMINHKALEAAAKALAAVQQPEVQAEYAWRVQDTAGRVELLNEAKAAVSAYLSAATAIEYAGSHKHGGLETTDEDGYPFESAEHVRENYADYPNCTPMYRLVTEWQELNKDMQ